MRPYRRCPFALFLVTLSLIAASAIPAEPPPFFLAKWGTTGVDASQFNSPRHAAVDATGSVYVTDSHNDRIQKFTRDRTLLVMWGWGVQDGSSTLQTCTSGCQAGISGSGNGQFNRPWGVAVDTSGNVFVAQSQGYRVQKFDSDGNYLNKWGQNGSGDGDLLIPRGVAVDASGNVYVADSGNHRIQKFSGSGAYLAQWGTNGSGDGEFMTPGGVAVDARGNVYVVDSLNDRIQKFAGPWLELFIGEPEAPSGR